MSDMKAAIAPKSDQLNADDLISGPRTIKISRVSVTGGPEQPVSIFFDGDNGKPYKPCKSMSRVMVQVWGADSSRFVGQSMTLYRDPDVKWGGMAIGGIRISHITGIDKPLTISLTASKGKWKPFTVSPLAQQKEQKNVSDGKEQKDTATDWQSWCAAAKDKISGMATMQEIDAWETVNSETINRLANENRKFFDRLFAIITDQRKKVASDD